MPAVGDVGWVCGVGSSVRPNCGTAAPEVVDLLKGRLAAVCPDGLRIVREQEARLGELLRRNPDLMAVRASACDPAGSSYTPETGLFTPGDTTAAPGLPWATVEVAALEP